MKIGEVVRLVLKMQKCAKTGSKTRYCTDPIILLSLSSKTKTTASLSILMTFSRGDFSLSAVPQLLHAWTVQPLPAIARGTAKNAFKMPPSIRH
jgi:hypothetical protein